MLVASCVIFIPGGKFRLYVKLKEQNKMYSPLPSLLLACAVLQWPLGIVKVVLQWLHCQAQDWQMHRASCGALTSAWLDA